MWYSATDTHLKLLDRAVSGARFLTRGVFECYIAHRRSPNQKFIEGAASIMRGNG